MLIRPFGGSVRKSALLFLVFAWVLALEPFSSVAKPSLVSAAKVLDASAVAVADEFSADAAEQIFKEGGNAVDAAVAIAFTLAVTYPEAGNIGGGGFMTLYVDGKAYFLDYRERAPLAATATMYLDDKGNVVPGMSVTGYRSVGVPGTVEGMWQAQQRFGKLKWRQVLAPAIHYARDGFVVDQLLEERGAFGARRFAGKTNYNSYFANLKQGVTFKQAELATVLERLAAQGEKDFYNGQTADLIVASMQHHGLITKADLAQYKAVWREPIEASWNGYQIYTAPPPSSGGIGLVQLLKMKADIAADFKDVPLNSAQYVHLMAELEKRVFADRAQYLGDPDFYRVPVAQLIDDSYLAKRASQVSVGSPSDTASITAGLGTSMPEKNETTHFSVIDKWGNAVSNTYTINGYFGSGVVVEHAGILLNDEMDDFSAKPGVANMFGVVGSDANAISPQKRPLSSMTPSILTKDGKVALVIGTPGGSRIFTTIFQVITNLYDFNLPLNDAIGASRFHHQLLPANTIYSEPFSPVNGDLAKQIESKGYTLRGQNFSGDIQAIEVIGSAPEPASDPRGRGVTRIIP